jgi:hypothetical protein
MHKKTKYKVPKLTKSEEALVEVINSEWDQDKALYELTSHLQVAATIELATIPIYLATYYTINRTPDSGTATGFPQTDVSRFADEAGALIMSVAVEEMLHMSLASNILYALGKDPQLYGQAPDSYPANLPGHAENVSRHSKHYSQSLPIPLAKFSFNQLSHFLAIEYPAPPGAPPEAGNWETIGQIYSYIRCIIKSKWIKHDDFKVRQNNRHQIASTEYSPNSIDTVFPKEAFDFVNPPAAPMEESAAKTAKFVSAEDSHLGSSDFLTINNCRDAMQAIATISFQGEGFAHEAYDDPSKDELSHYYKFVVLQSQLDGYDQSYVNRGLKHKNNVAPLPEPPNPACRQFTVEELDTFVYPAPFNPVSSQFGEGRSALVDISDALFQYMLIMTETIYRVPSDKQKIYFNRSMHQSMIWVLDKLLQKLRTIKTADEQNTLCSTFANIDLGTRDKAFGTMVQMVNSFEGTYGANGTAPADWYTTSGASYYLQKITELPDISIYWLGTEPAQDPAYLGTPADESGQGTGPRSTMVTEGDYKDTPKWPLSPPTDIEMPKGAQRHACMGLNSCADQGRTADNNCAGQGYCATALAYNPSSPSSPSVSDHTCHVLNDCRNQGGCGLYGTAEELTQPGHNDCQSLGSCATPINAERFICDGELQEQSVWLQARKVFTAKVWPELIAENPQLPECPPPVEGSAADANLFQYGPTIGWIENDNDGQGMTACGASGMSGAGSCA